MLNRYMCEVLTDMRSLTEKLEARTLSRYKMMMPYLIEEVQVMGNKMEAALADNADVRRYLKDVKKLKKQIIKLEEKRDELGGSSND